MSTLTTTESPSEARFDRISRMAQELFEAPIVSVTLRDRNRLRHEGRRREEPGPGETLSASVAGEGDTG
ncbi:MAG: hypothetical protein ACR2LI_02780, partial [Propionibacteriaceae bacterium]